MIALVESSFSFHQGPAKFGPQALGAAPVASEPKSSIKTRAFVGAVRPEDEGPEALQTSSAARVADGSGCLDQRNVFLAGPDVGLPAVDHFGEGHRDNDRHDGSCQRIDEGIGAAFLVGVVLAEVVLAVAGDATNPFSGVAVLARERGSSQLSHRKTKIPRTLSAPDWVKGLLNIIFISTFHKLPAFWHRRWHDDELFLPLTLEIELT